MQHRIASTKHDWANHLGRLFSILHATDAKRPAFFDRPRWAPGETLPWQGLGQLQPFLQLELLNHGQQSRWQLFHWQRSLDQHFHCQLQARALSRHPLLKLLVLQQRAL